MLAALESIAAIQALIGGERRRLAGAWRCSLGYLDTHYRVVLPWSYPIKPDPPRVENRECDRPDFSDTEVCESAIPITPPALRIPEVSDPGENGEAKRSL